MTLPGSPRQQRSDGILGVRLHLPPLGHRPGPVAAASRVLEFSDLADLFRCLVGTHTCLCIPIDRSTDASADPGTGAVRRVDTGAPMGSLRLPHRSRGYDAPPLRAKAGRKSAPGEAHPPPRAASTHGANCRRRVLVHCNAHATARPTTYLYEDTSHNAERRRPISQ